MSNDNKNNDYVDFFTETVKTQGVAVSTVKDGVILMFKREFLQNLLDSTESKEEVLIFVKQPEFKN